MLIIYQRECTMQAYIRTRVFDWCVSFPFWQVFIVTTRWPFQNTLIYSCKREFLILFEFTAYLMLGEKPARDLESSTPFHTLECSHLQKIRNPKLTPQTNRNLFTVLCIQKVWTSSHKDCPLGSARQFGSCDWPPWKGAETGNHYKSQKKSLSGESGEV